MGARTEQATTWNGAGGGAWVRMQAVLDAMFTEVGELLVDQVAEALPGTEAPRVLDVGCGTGATTLALTRRLGGSTCTGVDLSQPMIALARERAAKDGAEVDFVVADAQRHRFAPASAQVVASRSGVMFFDDPGAAFANLRAAVGDDGGLRAVVWRDPAENPFMTRPLQAATPLLEVSGRAPDAPGQFGLADPGRAVAVLQEAGWQRAAAEPVDFTCSFPVGELEPYLSSMGPLGRALAQHDEGGRRRVLDHVRPAFDDFIDGDSVTFTAACWSLSA